jgi:glycosyltransferase involved in cell wall biosynthesis
MGFRREQPGPPLVSVIIAVHNGERFLRAAIESVRAQVYRPVELIVVDDGSTDGSAEIAAAYPDLIYRRQAKKGVAAARNAGLAIARGEFLSFIDSDDLWTTDKLAVQVGFLGARPHLGYAVCHIRWFFDDGCVKPGWFRADLLNRPVAGLVPSALVARASTFARVGPFDPTLRVGEDFDWFLRARCAGVGEAIVPETLVHKRFHGANLTGPTRETSEIVLGLVRKSLRLMRANREVFPGEAAAAGARTGA